jgi:hypothetical protein
MLLDTRKLPGFHKSSETMFNLNIFSVIFASLKYVMGEAQRKQIILKMTCVQN